MKYNSLSKASRVVVETYERGYRAEFWAIPFQSKGGQTVGNLNQDHVLAKNSEVGVSLRINYHGRSAIHDKELAKNAVDLLIDEIIK